jgi:hypothetical protein
VSKIYVKHVINVQNLHKLSPNAIIDEMKSGAHSLIMK